MTITKEQFDNLKVGDVLIDKNGEYTGIHSIENGMVTCYTKSYYFREIEDWRLAKISHPHVEKMKLYYEDALETDKPWERWEFKRPYSTFWEDCTYNPLWSDGYEYRRKPKKVQVWQWVLEDPLNGKHILTDFSTDAKDLSLKGCRLIGPYEPTTKWIEETE